MSSRRHVIADRGIARPTRAQSNRHPEPRPERSEGSVSRDLCSGSTRFKAGTKIPRHDALPAVETSARDDGGMGLVGHEGSPTLPTWRFTAHIRVSEEDIATSLATSDIAVGGRTSSATGGIAGLYAARRDASPVASLRVGSPAEPQARSGSEPFAALRMTDGIGRGQDIESWCER